MFYAVTSKRKGCGRSTLALMSAMMVHNKSKGSTLLVDLGSNNDFCSIFNLKVKASIDNLISAISLKLDDLDLEGNIVHHNGLYILPGTAIKQPRYLEKRCNDIVFLLKELESKFNSIILDVDYTLYGDLVDCGLDITPIHVLEQNMLNVEGYQKDIQSQIFEGYYVVNRYEDDVFPSIDLFKKNFKRDILFSVNLDNNLKSIINRKSLDVGSLKGSSSFSGIDMISDVIVNGSNVVEKGFSGGKSNNKSQSLFSRLFGKKTTKTSTTRTSQTRPSQTRPKPTNSAKPRNSSKIHKAVKRVNRADGLANREV